MMSVPPMLDVKIKIRTWALESISFFQECVIPLPMLKLCIFTSPEVKIMCFEMQIENLSLRITVSLLSKH